MLLKWLDRFVRSKRNCHHRRLRRARSTLLAVELLEARLAPVIGSNSLAYQVWPTVGPVSQQATNLDGVCSIVTPLPAGGNLTRSGSELFDTRHILSAAHVLYGSIPAPDTGPYPQHQDTFNLIRTDGLPAGTPPIPVNIALTVPAGAAYQQVPASWNPRVSWIDDIGLDTIVDQSLIDRLQILRVARQGVKAVEKRFGQAQGVWVMDRGMISKDSLKFLKVMRFHKYLRAGGWERLADHAEVEVKPLRRGRVCYLLARSKPRRQKERAMRRRQRRGLARALQKLHEVISKKRLRSRDRILERIGRLKARFPKAKPFVSITVTKHRRAKVRWQWHIDKFKAALATDGVYLLRSNQAGWSAAEFWETYMQLTVVERAFRILKSHLLLRPIWHHYSGRTQAHVFVCVLAYALWKTLDHLAKRAGLQTEIHKPDVRRRHASPKARPMTPEVILRELREIQIGDIILETTEGAKLSLRRVARPKGEAARILAALQLELPERLSPDRLL